MQKLFRVKAEKKFIETGDMLSMTESKVIGYVEFFGKLNAIVLKDGKVELQETDTERSDCWLIISKLLNRE